MCINVCECMCISCNAQYKQKLTISTSTISSTTSSASRHKPGGSWQAGSLGVSLEVSQPETENVRHHLKQGKNFLVGSP